VKIEDVAARNFERCLRQNPYPGRGLVVGRASEECWVILYWIMGRSANSRNRRFVADGGVLRTEPVDLSQVTDPSLIIYEAMLELPGVYLVSNGDQTRTMYEAIQAGKTIEDALAAREREPDAPNFTPRISGMLDIRGRSPAVTLSMLKANLADPGHSDRFYYRVAMPKVGLAAGLTTYSGDGTPLPSFSGDPLVLPCEGRAEEMLEAYWNALDAGNRISIAAKEISVRVASSRILVLNRF
jgi:IMP cyclohydrolase